MVAFVVGQKEEEAGFDAEGFQVVQMSKAQKWKHMKYMREQLASADVMGDNEIETIKGWITTSQYDITRNLELPHRLPMLITIN